VRASIRRMGVRWEPWMQAVMLYYYYPEKLAGVRPWVKELAEVLVACEQFEAYSNQRRGRDYYVRTKETIAEAFAYLDTLEREGILGARVMRALKQLAAAGRFDGIIAEARGSGLTVQECRFLRRVGR